MTKIENDERSEDPTPPPSELRATILVGQALAGQATISAATLIVTPPPKPPWYRRFMDLNLKAAKALFKVVKMVGSIGSAFGGWQTILDALKLSRSKTSVRPGFPAQSHFSPAASSIPDTDS